MLQKLGDLSATVRGILPAGHFESRGCDGLWWSQKKFSRKLFDEMPRFVPKLPEVFEGPRARSNEATTIQKGDSSEAK